MPPLKEVYENYGTIKAVKKSARRGCHLCSLIYDDSKNYTKSTRLDDFVYSLEIIDFITRRQNRQVWFKVIVEGKLFQNIRMIPCQPSSLGADTLSKSLKYVSTASDEAFQMASSWLTTCLESHTTCSRPSSSGGFLPSRLLHVSLHNEVLRMKLCPRQMLIPEVQYLTLSYCWGNTNHFVLTSQTCSAFETNIPITELPKSILDSALITIRLGYSYLWVDSLCIVQDELDDWSKEARTIGQVYGNSVLTIATTVTDNSDGGCFSIRNPLASIPCTLPVFEPRSKWPWIAAPGPGCGPNVRGGGSPPLNRRGWVVQERASARRTLYYASDLIHWECIQCSGCETSPQLYPDMNTTKHILYQLLHTQYNGADVSWLPLWWKILENYTHCNLTLKEDKWNALSGLAHLVQEKLQLALKAGHWVQHILQDITWRVTPYIHEVSPDGVKQNTTTPSSVAPTWSWISINAPVIFCGVSQSRSKAYQEVSEVLEIQHMNNIPVSLVVGLAPATTISIKGPLRSLVWRSEIVHSITEYHDYGKFVVFRVLNLGPDLEDTEYGPRWFPDHYTIDDDGVERWLLQTGAAKTDVGSYEVTGLVITQVDSTPLYRRVGAFRFTLAADQSEPDTILTIGKIGSVLLI